ncbi:hypothetical protein [Fluviicola sp.]|uniref:hypothetical protein n=1 Tax=Fluviicola sp. TaxID=1917219 RepID=UPI0031D62544
MRLLFIVFILSLTACTITKRHFGPGYHVEWKKSHSEEEHQSNKENQSDYPEDHPGKSEITVQVTSSPSPIDSIRPKVSQKSEVILGDTEADVASYPENSKSAFNEDFPMQMDQPSLEDPKEEPAKKTEPLTWVAFILLVGIGISAGLISMYSSFLYLGAGIFLTGLALLLTVFAFISFVRVVRNRDRYKNKGLTYLLFFISITALFVGAVYLIAVSALSSMTPIMGY